MRCIEGMLQEQPHHIGTIHIQAGGSQRMLALLDALYQGIGKPEGKLPSGFFRH
ncbi:MAG: hypothetical protein RL685_5822 [Pseudomonadota bacterium]|jgi:hypothetical protein